MRCCLSLCTKHINSYTPSGDVCIVFVQLWLKLKGFDYLVKFHIVKFLVCCFRIVTFLHMKVPKIFIRALQKFEVYCVRNVVAHGDAREGKWRGNWRMEWVASTLTRSRSVVYTALLTLMRAPRLPAVDWTDAPADLNGLVRLGERRNLVSARVPSGFKRAIPLASTLITAWKCYYMARRSGVKRSDEREMVYCVIVDMLMC